MALGILKKEKILRVLIANLFMFLWIENKSVSILKKNRIALKKLQID
jgi:hypothetical protein